MIISKLQLNEHKWGKQSKERSKLGNWLLNGVRVNREMGAVREEGFLGAKHVHKRTHLGRRFAALLRHDHSSGPSSLATEIGCRSPCPCSRRGRHCDPLGGRLVRRAARRYTRLSGPAERFETCADICIAR